MNRELAEDQQVLALMDAMRNEPPKLLTQSSRSTVSVSQNIATGSGFSGDTDTVTAENHRDRAKSPVVTGPAHPFSNSSAKLVLIPASSTTDGIDVEEEARLYDELSRSYEDVTDEFSRSNTPTRGRLVKPKPGPNRPRPRSLPPESIFSADIFLADNTGHTALGVAPLFAQDVNITGWSTVGDGGGSSKSVGGGGAYIVYDCVITTKEGTTMHVLKRYSAFERLRQDLKRTLPYALVPLLPSLPPKSTLGRFRPAFLDSRRKLLQHFLAAVLLHPEIGGREVVRRWVLS